MKKIIMLLTFIIMMFCQVCGAFQEPDPNRWLFVAEGEGGYCCWLDLDRMRFNNEFDGTLANFWTLAYYPDRDVAQETNVEMKLDRREFKFISMRVYAGNGNLLGVLTDPPIKYFQSIEPGSISDCVLSAVISVHNSRN